jgi:hypothetical protein
MKRWLPGRAVLAVTLALAAALPGAGASASAAPARTAQESAHAIRVFRAALTGEQQVPAVQTGGIGAAAFEVARDRRSIGFQLAAKDLSSEITGAHIHLGAAGSNGPVVVELVMSTGVSGTAFFTSGRLTPADQVGPLAGQPDFGQLIAAMSGGSAYVNVHTSDFPAGEVRGQVEQPDS